MEKLPVEITSNILLRLPFKSIGQGRCVSKLWCSILYDDSLKLRQNILFDFTYRSRIVCLQDNEETFNQTPIKLFKKFDSYFFTNHFYENENPYVLGSCNGFFCLAKDELVPCNPIYVFNPITEEHAMLPYYEYHEHDILIPDGFSCGYESRIERCFSGFGFEDSTKTFKLVFVIFSGWEISGSELLGNELQVHTLGTNTWSRKVGVVPKTLSKATTDALANNGCLHWITYDFHLILESFNLALEEFGFVPIPDSIFLELHWRDQSNLSLGLVEDCLSIVDCSLERGVINIWVMKTYNVHESWIKEYSLELGCVSHLSHLYALQFIKFLSNGEILLVGHGNCLVSYNITSQQSRFLEVDWVDEGDYFKAFPFVGSLLSLKSACGIDKNAAETNKMTFKEMKSLALSGEMDDESST